MRGGLGLLELPRYTELLARMGGGEDTQVHIGLLEHECNLPSCNSQIGLFVTDPSPKLG